MASTILRQTWVTTIPRRQRAIYEQEQRTTTLARSAMLLVKLPERWSNAQPFVPPQTCLVGVGEQDDGFAVRGARSESPAALPPCCIDKRNQYENIAAANKGTTRGQPKRVSPKMRTVHVHKLTVLNVRGPLEMCCTCAALLLYRAILLVMAPFVTCLLHRLPAHIYIHIFLELLLHLFTKMLWWLCLRSLGLFSYTGLSDCRNVSPMSSTQTSSIRLYRQRLTTELHG